MTLEILVRIFFWTFAAVLFIGLVFIIFLIGKKSVKDNSLKGAVFIKTGLHISSPVKAERSTTTGKGSGFMYGKGKIVIVPKSYGEHYFCNRIMIIINQAGQLIASPFNEDKELSPDEKNDLIYEICASHVGSDGMRALKGKSQANILIIAIIAFIVGVSSVIGFNAFQEQMLKRQVPQEQEIQITPNIP